MKIFKNLFSREKQDWRLVKVQEFGYEMKYFRHHPRYGQFDDNKEHFTMTYYFYEDQNGNRKIDAIDEQRGDLDLKKLEKDDWVFRNNYYRKTIRPWLDGVYDPDIPTYESVERKGMLAILSHKKMI